MKSLDSAQRAACRSRALAATVAACGIVTLSLSLSGCGGGQSPRTNSGTTPASGATIAAAPPASATGASYRGPTLQNPAPAPPIVLPDYLGHHVNTAGYRGKAVLLTFIYTHCPDTCPLIVATLHNALSLLGSRASEARVVAVSTDPKGDTRAAVASFLARRAMTRRMEYLVAGRSELVPVWRDWGISVSDPTGQDKVNHSALVYGITGSGKVTVVYPANFTAADIAHDVPLLAAH